MLLHSDNMQNPLDTLQTPQTQHRHPPERQYLKALVASKQDNTKLTFPTVVCGVLRVSEGVWVLSEGSCMLSECSSI